MSIKSALAGFALFLSGCFSHNLSANNDEKIKTELVKTPEERFQQAMHAIMNYHEKALNIKYPKRMPAVNFSIPEFMGYMRREFFVGSYNEEENYFEINPIYQHCDLTSLLDPKNVISTEDVNCNPIFLRSFLSHELGHYFVDCLIEREFPRSWLQEHLKTKKRLGPDNIGVLIVREGIGTYFEKIFDSKKEPEFFDESWRKDYERRDFLTPSVVDFIAYEGGHNLVKPLIDTHGLEGIKYLIKEKLDINVPRLESVIAYREKAMLELVENKK